MSVLVEEPEQQRPAPLSSDYWEPMEDIQERVHTLCTACDHHKCIRGMDPRIRISISPGIKSSLLLHQQKQSVQ